jgi:hypothetical protein
MTVSAVIENFQPLHLHKVLRSLVRSETYEAGTVAKLVGTAETIRRGMTSRQSR